jgi:hypothetical protein
MMKVARWRVMIDAFSAAPEFTERYPTSLVGRGADRPVVYQQLFNRLADAGGKAFYLDRLQSGAITRQRLMFDILLGTGRWRRGGAGPTRPRSIGLLHGVGGGEWCCL